MTASKVPPTWVADADEPVTPHLESSALLIIDTQTDFVDGGANPIAGTTAVLPKVTALQSAFRAAGRPVIHVVRIYAGDDVDRVRRTALAAGARTVAPDSDGSQVVPELRAHWAAVPEAKRLLAGEIVEVATGEVVLWKPRWSAFHRTRLHDILAARGVDTVVVAGCNFPNCPRATIYASSDHDYRVLVPSDAVSGITSTHLDELGRIGVLHTSTSAIAAALDSVA